MRKAEDEVAECTFSPRINKRSPLKASPIVHSSRAALAPETPSPRKLQNTYYTRIVERELAQMLEPDSKQKEVVLTPDVFMEMMHRFGYCSHFDEILTQLASDAYYMVTGEIKPLHRGFHLPPSGKWMQHT